MKNGTPPKGAPSGMGAPASLRAWSSIRVTTAFSSSFTRSTRAMHASTSSRGEAFLSRTSCARPSPS